MLSTSILFAKQNIFNSGFISNSDLRAFKQHENPNQAVVLWHIDQTVSSGLNPAHTVWFWPRFGCLRQILKILKDSYNPLLKSVVFDRWLDMFTDSRLMAVAIRFHLRRNSGSVRRFGTLSCSVTTPTMNVKLCLFFKTSYEQNYCYIIILSAINSGAPVLRSQNSSDRLPFLYKHWLCHCFHVGV